MGWMTGECKRTGKRRYDRISAMFAVSDLERTQTVSARLYRCKFCRAYHVTSQEKRVKP